MFPALSVPGLRPVSVKGIQAALRALGPSLDRARPALAEGQGCGLTRTLVSDRVVSTTEFPQWGGFRAFAKTRANGEVAPKD
jgi:hypothetical protein